MLLSIICDQATRGGGGGGICAYLETANRRFRLGEDGQRERTDGELLGGIVHEQLRVIRISQLI